MGNRRRLRWIRRWFTKVALTSSRNRACQAVNEHFLWLLSACKDLDTVDILVFLHILTHRRIGVRSNVIMTSRCFSCSTSHAWLPSQLPEKRHDFEFRSRVCYSFAW